MPELGARGGPLDPAMTNRFRVGWDGRHIAGVSRITALRRVTEVITQRDGTDPSSEHRLPGRSKYEAITLERGITHETDFEEWANEVFDFGAGAQVPSDFLKDIVIELLDERGEPIHVYTVFRCWVSEYQAISDLDANANAVAIESLKLEHEGWQRDDSVPTPTEGDDCP